MPDWHPLDVEPMRDRGGVLIRWTTKSTGLPFGALYLHRDGMWRTAGATSDPEWEEMIGRTYLDHPEARWTYLADLVPQAPAKPAPVQNCWTCRHLQRDTDGVMCAVATEEVDWWWAEMDLDDDGMPANPKEDCGGCPCWVAKEGAHA